MLEVPHGKGPRTRRPGPAHLASLALDASDAAPLHRQLYLALRAAILAGRLRPGGRLPSTRRLAADLGVSRNTVLAAFAQLHAEGYLVGATGSGSFVSRELPEATLEARGTPVRAATPVPAPQPSARGRALAALAMPATAPRPFAPGLPELALFPFEEWGRLLARTWRRPHKGFLIGSDPAGHPSLREAIAAHLGAARAVTCDADQVFVVSGAQQALDLAARVLVDPNDAVWVEDPGYPGLRGALLAAAARLVPVPVDTEGLSLTAGRALEPGARLICVSPSHQYPLGITMSLARRLALLEFARAADAYLLEDDYDSEYRYAGKPLAALQGLDVDGRVIYVGTLSKVMFPGLRLGFMVVPRHLIEAFRAVRRLTDSHPSSIAQPALAQFMASGQLAAHIRRMRTLYAERQARFIELCRTMLPAWLEVGPAQAGMHLVAALPPTADDVAMCAAARDRGVEAPALSTFYMAGQPRRGLLLGYAGVGEGETRMAMARLAAALTEAGPG